MDIKTKALEAIENFILSDIIMSPEKKLEQIYMFAHVALGRCKNKHKDWEEELNKFHKALRRKTMTFQEAKGKLEELAEGRYHTLRYELTEHSDGKQKQVCGVYVDKDSLFYEGETWEEAFKSRDEGKKALEQMPQECVL